MVFQMVFGMAALSVFCVAVTGAPQGMQANFGAPNPNGSPVAPQPGQAAPANNATGPAPGGPAPAAAPAPPAGPQQGQQAAPSNIIQTGPGSIPSAPLGRPTEANSNLASNMRSKRQAGIPPVCCTKDPCDPCATTPCIACPLCG